ncbi:hypothetical protein XBLMG947_3208 [Xanthomonas bromi]|uniref:Secreted protein n=1 Tax=Xanthomonas bromi TaxID=56449 RepID=A0A1C3NPT7_9XANT|nr:hypothetical protein [Xanthomonas bromi]SBV52413.1 hypothetical protein XBLMG947_3208 [Xanthomonas bromi]
MRWMGLVVVAAAFAGCSCHRSADPQANEAPATQAATASHSRNKGTPGDVPASSAPTADPNDAIARTNYAQASATVQRYLGALPGARRADADALWTGGRPSPVPDDAALRAIGNIQSMRINNDSPIALDQAHPPQRIEVPVQVTVRTTTGTQRLVGAYRLQPRAGSDGWEIYSATLQPVLR